MRGRVGNKEEYLELHLPGDAVDEERGGGGHGGGGKQEEAGEKEPARAGGEAQKDPKGGGSGVAPGPPHAAEERLFDVTIL